MADPIIKVNGSIARVVGLEKVRGKMKDGQGFAFTALGTNIYEKRGDNPYIPMLREWASQQIDTREMKSAMSFCNSAGGRS